MGDKIFVWTPLLYYIVSLISKRLNCSRTIELSTQNIIAELIIIEELF